MLVLALMPEEELEEEGLLKELLLLFPPPPLLKDECLETEELALADQAGRPLPFSFWNRC